MHNVQTDNDPYQNYVNSVTGQLTELETEITNMIANINALQTQLNTINDLNNPNGYYQLQTALIALLDQQYAEQKKEGDKYHDPELDAKVNAAQKAFDIVLNQQVTDINTIKMDTTTLNTMTGQLTALINQLSSDPNNGLNIGALQLLARRLIQDANNATKGYSNDPNQQLQNAQQSVQNYQDNVNDMVNAMINYMNDIVACQNEKDNDEAYLKVAENNLIIDCIKLAAATASIFGCFFDGDLVDNVERDEQEISEYKSDISRMDAAIASDRTNVKTLLSSLASISTDQLNDMISSMVDEVKKIIALILSPGGNSEGNMQQAACALVAILAILEAVVSKVHQQHAQDQQFMSLASTDNFEMASNKSQTSLTEFNDALQFAATMQVLMDIAQGVLTAASVVAAVASGGAGSILVAAVFAVFTTINIATENKVDIMGEALDKLADALPGNGNTASKVLADLIMAVAVMVVIMAGDKAGGMWMAPTEAGVEASEQAAQQAAKQAAAEAAIAAAPAAEQAGVQAGVEDADKAAAKAVQEVVEEVDKSLQADLNKLVVNGAEDADQAGQNAAIKSAEDVAKNPSTLSKTWQTLRKPVMLTVMNFMMFNGFADSFQAVAEKIKSKKDLENDEIFQILKIIAGLVQVVLMIVAGSKASGGNAEQEEAEGNFLQKLLGKMDVQFNPVTIAQFTMAMQATGNILSMASNLGMVDVNNTKADVDKSLGATAATMVVYQNILNVIKNTQEVDSQQAAAQLQQLSASIQETAQKMALAENEAARLITENAM